MEHFVHLPLEDREVLRILLVDLLRLIDSVADIAPDTFKRSYARGDILPDAIEFLPLLIDHPFRLADFVSFGILHSGFFELLDLLIQEMPDLLLQPGELGFDCQLLLVVFVDMILHEGIVGTILDMFVEPVELLSFEHPLLPEQ